MSLTWKKCGRRTGPCVVLRPVKPDERAGPTRVSGGGARDLFGRREDVVLDETDAVSRDQPHLVADDEDVPF